MSDPFFDKLIADLVKGAEANSRANGGPGVNIEVDRENRGREVKLAHSRVDTLRASRDAGARAAAAAFGIKEAFLGAALGMLGSVGGGMLARKALPSLTGIAGHAAEMGGQMLGGAAASHMAPQPRQPMM